MRYFIHLAYNGSNYHGWQAQPHQVTIQSVIEEALRKLLGADIPIVGAGRTDAGVNARQMYAHADFPDGFKPDGRFLRSFNALCGRDIAIYDLLLVTAEAHARFDATGRTYRYHIHKGKDPFAEPFSWQASADLDFEAIDDAASLLIGTHDFTSFSKLHTDVKTNICTITAAHLMHLEDNRYAFEISADRFLRNMVRAVVGTLVEVGRHKITKSDLADIIAARDRCAAGTSMPPQPLFLHRITYPDAVFIKSQ